MGCNFFANKLYSKTTFVKYQDFVELISNQLVVIELNKTNLHDFGSFELFFEKCIRCNKPRQNIINDEQFFPSKTRCLFTQFIESKPDKYGKQN